MKRKFIELRKINILVKFFLLFTSMTLFAQEPQPGQLEYYGDYPFQILKTNIMEELSWSYEDFIFNVENMPKGIIIKIEDFEAIKNRHPYYTSSNCFTQLVHNYIYFLFDDWFYEVEGDKIYITAIIGVDEKENTPKLNFWENETAQITFYGKYKK